MNWSTLPLWLQIGIIVAAFLVVAFVVFIVFLGATLSNIAKIPREPYTKEQIEEIKKRFDK